jgi:hypothetical protein
LVKPKKYYRLTLALEQRASVRHDFFSYEVIMGHKGLLHRPWVYLPELGGREDVGQQKRLASLEDSTASAKVIDYWP